MEFDNRAREPTFIFSHQGAISGSAGFFEGTQKHPE
jgi:hypothetical protein